MATDEIETLLQEIKAEANESDKKLPPTISDYDIPEEISQIQNKFVLMCNDLHETKTNIRDRLDIVDKTELIMNLLNYKTYEVRYEFTEKLNELAEKKKQIEKDVTGNESQIALGLVDINKEIKACEQFYDEHFQTIKHQKLETQLEYEKSINVLDGSLEIMKDEHNHLLLLIESQKAELGDIEEDYFHMSDVRELGKDLDELMELQTGGWKTSNSAKRASELPIGIRFADEGFLVTGSGHQITYEDAKAQNVLQRLVELVKEKKVEKKPSIVEMSAGTQSPVESNESEDSTMSSQDVMYLKENLGIPLTLALAEITAIQPRDPIHYLGHWLFKYRYNQEIGEIQRIELEQLTSERERIMMEKWHKFIEEEARAAVLDMIIRAEDEALQNELIRIQMESEAEEEDQEENLNDEARDQFDTYGGGPQPQI